MHDQIRHDLSQGIDALSDGEKLELIEELAHSLRASKNGGSQEMPSGQKQQLLDSVRRISSLPMEGSGRFSGRDHDQVLYGTGRKGNSAS